MQEMASGTWIQVMAFCSTGFIALGISSNVPQGISKKPKRFWVHSSLCAKNAGGSSCVGALVALIGVQCFFCNKCAIWNELEVLNILYAALNSAAFQILMRLVKAKLPSGSAIGKEAVVTWLAAVATIASSRTEGNTTYWYSWNRFLSHWVAEKNLHVAWIISDTSDIYWRHVFHREPMCIWCLVYLRLWWFYGQSCLCCNE